MQIRALKTFNGRMGLVRTGTVITVDDKYGQKLVSSKLAEVHVPKDTQPESNTNLGDAPQTKDVVGNVSSDDERGLSSQGEGKDKDAGTQSPPDPESGSTESSSVQQRIAGKTPPLSSPRAGRRSRK